MIVLFVIHLIFGAMEIVEEAQMNFCYFKKNRQGIIWQFIFELIRYRLLMISCFGRLLGNVFAQRAVRERAS